MRLDRGSSVQRHWSNTTKIYSQGLLFPPYKSTIIIIHLSKFNLTHPPSISSALYDPFSYFIFFSVTLSGNASHCRLPRQCTVCLSPRRFDHCPTVLTESLRSSSIVSPPLISASSFSLFFSSSFHASILCKSCAVYENDSSLFAVTLLPPHPQLIGNS